MSTLPKTQLAPLPGFGLPLVLPALVMIAVTYGLARFSYGLFLPEFRSTFDLGPELLGLIGGGSYAGYCVAILATGYLCRRFSPRNVVAIAGVVATTGMSLIAVAPSGATLATGVLVAGIAAGFASPPMGDAVQARIEERRHGSANTWINSGTSIGVLASGPVALLAGAAWRPAWMLFAFAALAATLWCWRTLPSVPPTASTLTTSHRPPLGLSTFKRPQALTLMASAGIMGLVSSVYWTFSRDLIVQQGAVGPQTSIVFWMVLGASGIVGGLAGWLVLRWGLRKVLKLSLIGFGLAIIALAAAPGAISVVFASAAGFGAIYILLTGAYLVWSIRVFYDQPSLGITLAFLLIAIGQVIGAPLAGVIANLGGTQAAFWTFGLVAIVGASFGPSRRGHGSASESRQSVPPQRTYVPAS